MYKILTLLVFVLASSNAEDQKVAPHVINTYNSSILHTDVYITLTRQQHENNLQEYNNQMEIFKQTYAAGLNAIEVQGNMLIDSLNQKNERLNLLEALSEFSKACVSKYRRTIPKVQPTKTSIKGCINTAQNQVNNMLYNPLASKTYLENYYENVYENNLKNCKSKYNTDYYYLNYTMCVVDATNAAQEYTIDNQKLFTSQMHTSRCTADGNIRKAFECSYSVQNSTMSLTTEADVLINKCLLGQDECKQCSVGYYCSYISYVDRNDVSYYSKTMANPFYDRYEVKDCLMLKIKN